MKWTAGVLLTLLAVIISGQYLINLSLEGPALDNGPEQLNEYVTTFGSEFSSVNCDDASDFKSSYNISLMPDIVQVNETKCEIGKFYDDSDLIGLGIKLKKCRYGKIIQPRKVIILSLEKNGGRIHMISNFKHVHLCSQKPINNASL